MKRFKQILNRYIPTSHRLAGARGKIGIIIVTFCILSIFGSAQRIRYITDTSDILYAPDNYGFSIDSIVYQTGSISPLIVYYDRSNKTEAFKSVFIKDSCICYDYWRNGRLKMKTVYVKNKSNDFVVWYNEAYCQNGNLICRNDIYIHKHKVIIYYCNGQKKCEYVISGAVLDGLVSCWYENGRLKSQAYYKANSDITRIKIGKWEFYNESGGLDSTELYKDDKLIKTIKK